MKKPLYLFLMLCLCAMVLCACHRGTGENEDTAAQSDGSRFAPDVTAVPEVGSHGEEDQSRAVETMPTLEPVETVGSTEGDGAEGEDDGYFNIDALLDRSIEGEEDGELVTGPELVQNPAPQPVNGRIDPNTYQYSALTDNSLGFTFNYPSHWVSVPGVYTVCFREPPSEDKPFPARVAITVKNLVHTPDETVMTEQMTSYMRIIHKQYDSSTFESGTPNLQDTFMGKPALSNTYLAFSGKTEVKGFVIGAAAGRTMCVFHFCASYEDYTALEGVMRYMLASVQPVQSE